MDVQLDKHFIQVGDVQLHVVFAGPEDGEPIIFLHGFPEFWYGWSKQIPYFAEKGYRVIVPDQRGYNLSDKPDGKDAYYIDTLATDVKNLAEALGYEKIYLVGHDWGAAVSWRVAMMYPDLLKKLTILNVPHVDVMQAEFKKLNFAQLFKSWYILFFQLPNIPEAIMSRNNYQSLADTLKGTSNTGSFSDADLEQYRMAWSQDGALTSMINWYRAMVQSASQKNTDYSSRITMQTLILWGENDVALTKELALLSTEYCDDAELVYYPKATHWVQQDEADDVNQRILEFISQTETEAEPVAE